MPKSVASPTIAPRTDAREKSPNASCERRRAATTVTANIATLPAISDAARYSTSPARFRVDDTKMLRYHRYFHFTRSHGRRDRARCADGRTDAERARHLRTAVD